MATELRLETQSNNAWTGGTSYFLRTDGSTALEGNLDAGTFTIQNLPLPSAGTDAANKDYVDQVAQGLDVKESVRLLQDSDVTLSGGTPDSVDNVALASGDRILVTGQSVASENGIYVVDTVGTGANGTWTRAADADGNAEVTAGLFTFVEEGSNYADSGWVLTTDDPITVGSTSLAFSQFSGAGQITAGEGLTKTGDTIDFVAGDASLIVNQNSVVVNLDATYLTLTGSGVGFADIGVAEIYVGDGTGTPTATALGGDASLSSGGTLTVLTPGIAGDTQTIQSTGSGIRVAESDGGNLLIAQGSGTPTQFEPMTGDASIVSNGTLTVATPGTALVDQTIKSTGSGVKVGDGNSGEILIGQGSGTDTSFQAISGDATLANDGTLTLTTNYLELGELTFNETPTGAIDNVNTVYTTASNFTDGTERVYLNGARQEKGVDYSVTAANEITFTSAPLSGGTIVIDYI